MTVLRHLPAGTAALASFLLVVCGGLPDAARALAPQRIAAVVNDDVVSMQDLTNRLHLVMVTSGIPDTEEARARLAPQVLRGLIEETLQLQEAERLGITVAEQEIEGALQNIAERNNLNVDELHAFLRENGVDPDTLARQLRAQIAWVKVVNRQVRPRVNVTVDQLELAVEEASRTRGEPEVLLSEIVLPVDNPAQEEAVARDAMRLVQTLREGASFESLARQVSVAASAEQGGDLGWVRASAMPDQLWNALDRMQPGDVSEPIRSNVGYHVFWLRDRRLRAGASETAGAVEVELTQILFPATDGADEAELERLRAQAAAVRDRLDDCRSMVEVAEELAAPASGRLGWLSVGDLPRGLGETVASLPVGEVSPPLEGPAGIHLLMVCDRRAPDAAPAQAVQVDRETLAQRLETERIEQLARRYLRDLRKQAFVEVRL